MTRRRARGALLVVVVLLIVATYPTVWALGYQDHPWHFHTAADVTAFVAVLVATVTHVLGERATPPLPQWATRLAIGVALAALGSALMWDVFGRPSDSDVQGGPAFVLVPLAGVTAAVASVILVARLLRRRLDTRLH